MARAKVLIPKEQRAKQIQNDMAWLSNTLPHLDTQPTNLVLENMYGTAAWKKVLWKRYYMAENCM